MSLLVRAGVSKLSELEIDSDKDWQGKGLFNIREIVPGMAIGDLVQHDGVKLVKLPPGTANYVLTSEGSGKLALWAPGGTYFQRYFPVSLVGVRQAGVISPRLIARAVPLERARNTTQTPSGSSSFGSTLAAAVTAPGNVAKAASFGRQFFGELTYPVGGAVAEDGGAMVDQTAAANNDVINDMTLLPAIPTTNDAYYLGYVSTFGKARINQGTAGAGQWAIAWEYWNGSAWALLSNVIDETDGFRAGGIKNVSFDIPGDWDTRKVMASLGWLYWIRARVTTFISVVTQPLGTRASIVQPT